MQHQGGGAAIGVTDLLMYAWQLSIVNQHQIRTLHASRESKGLGIAPEPQQTPSGFGSPELRRATSWCAASG
jgi:hypothetical protein